MTDTNTPAHWRKEIERLAKLERDAEQGLEQAKQRAAVALLDGGEDGSKELTLWRDRIEATQTALNEAQHRLDEAEAAVTQKQRDAALKRAGEAARARHQAAHDFDQAMADAERAYQKFLGANLTWQTEMRNAGQKSFSMEKLAAHEALRGAMTAAAFGLSGALNTRPHNRGSRLPLASFVATQTPPAPSARAAKRKAA